MTDRLFKITVWRKYMHGKRKGVLLALFFMAMLIIPVGLAGAGSNVEVARDSDDTIIETDQKVGDSGSVNGNAIARDGATIEKVDGNDVKSIMGKDMQFPDMRSRLAGRQVELEDIKDRKFDLEIPGRDIDTSRVRIPKNMMLTSDPTRAEDNENQNDDDDLANGTKIAMTETVSGELFSDSSTVNPQSDVIDWFKVQIPQGSVNPQGGALGVKNFTLTLTDFSSPDATLDEYDDDGEVVTGDYVDTLEIYIWYSHYSWTGFMDMGGKMMLYDNDDPGDGWEPSSGENWTTSFRTPIDSQGTTEDTDGFVNTLTERGWYYIGVRYLYYLIEAEAGRDFDYNINYEFEIAEEDTEINNYPFSTSYTQGAGNDWKNGTTTEPDPNARVDSGWNSQDWYEIKGVNREKLWNLSFNFSITGAYYKGMGSLGYIPDAFVYVTRCFYSWGEDGIEGTEDDGWYGRTLIFTFQYPSVPEQGLYNINDANAFNNYFVSNWTDAPTEIDGNDPRSYFVSIRIESLNLVVSGSTIQGLTYGTAQTRIDYNLDLSYTEREPNTPPQITDITVESDWEQAETGGYYGSEFTIKVTYMDVDNDAPRFIWLEIDGDSPIDLIDEGDPLAPNDKDYTDADPIPGKVYYITFFGDQLGENPSPHEIRVWAFDKMPQLDIRSSKRSNDLWDFNLTVWDDDPVELIDNWEGIPTLTEDEPERLIPLEGFEGAFRDPENRFRGFNIWNESLGSDGGWDTDYESDLMYVNISKVDGIWQMRINLKHNQWTTEGEPIRLRAYDDYSEVNRTARVFVNPVNDPPKVFHIIYDGMEYDVDNEIDPMRPVLHLEDSDDIFMTQDEEFTFEIYAEDTDPETEWGTLTYDFEDGLSDNWKEAPDVGYNDGVVTYTPVNYDVEKENQKMAFSISDGDSDGTIILTVWFEVKNKNDAPSISIPATTPRQYTQYQGGGMRVKPIAEDEDLRLPTSIRDSLTYSVNFEESIEHDGDEIDAIEDQLPYMDVSKDIDWGIDPNTGEFWFNPNDQKIWQTSSGWVKSIEINLVFQVTDKEGASATDMITLVLNDLNEEPPAPDSISADPDPSTEIYVGDEIRFSVDSVSDPDGDKITYKWDFGDGSQSEGQNVTHTYSKKGFKTVQAWVTDGQFDTEKISLRIEILEEEDDDNGGGDPNGGTTTPGGGEEETDNTLFIILGVVALLVIIIVVVILVVVLRKKEAPPAQQYPMYDQGQLGAYDAQGLPPGQADQLGGGAAPELPPGQGETGQPQELPPAQQEMQAQQEAPQAQPETQQQPEQAPGSACPSCGSPVDPSWFLCPNCKSPLQ